MEYANTFSLDFPVELWRPFAQDRPSVRCSSGYLIYLQGTEATCFYYLKKGKVKSFIQSEDGAERTLNLVMPGLAGLTPLAALMSALRQSPPDAIAGVPVAQPNANLDRPMV